MGEQQNRHEPIKAREFNVDNRKFRRRMKRAIRELQRNKAVGVDNFHSEMMQVAAIDVAAILNEAIDYLVAVLDLTKA